MKPRYQILLLVAFAALCGPALGQTFHEPGVYDLTARTLTQDGEQFSGVGGLQRWRLKGAVDKRTAATVLMYAGPTDVPALSLISDGCDVERLNFWRDYYGGGRSGGTAITIANWGKHNFYRLGFANFDTCIHCLPSNHCDESSYKQILVNNCRVFYKNEEKQSTGCRFECIYVYGKGETVFDLAKGGNIEIDTLVINEPRTIFRIRETSSNTCTITVNNLKVDNNAAGWRLLQMDKPGPINLTVRGHIGQNAAPGEKPIVIPAVKSTPSWTPPKDYQVLDVALWWGNMWKPKIEDCRP